MSFQRLSTILFCWFILSGCSESLRQDAVRWSGLGPAPLKPKGVDNAAPILQAGKTKILFQIQKFDGVEIEGNYYKDISSGKTDFVAYKWSSEIPVQWRAQVLSMKNQSSSAVRGFFLKNPNYEAKDLTGSPDIVILSEGPRWKFVFQNSLGQLEALYADRKLQVVRRKYLGSDFVNASATLFPDGPLKSQLENVLLKNLSDNRTLTSPRVKVSTQSDEKALSENSQFLFPVEDRRFEQVQTFFYLSQALEWAEKNFEFKVPFTVEAETSVGFPQRTNTAFYYQRKIRLGDGDDQFFSKMALDPSIVTHETFHAVIDAVARLPFEGEGGSINEGFADYFATSLLNNPNLGEASYKKGPFKRTVANNLRVGEKNGGLYHDSGIVSGTFWSLQKSLGAEVASKVAWDTLLRLVPDSDFPGFQRELIEVVSQLPEEQKARAKTVLVERGWME